MSDSTSANNQLGPTSYANFRAKANGAPCLGIVEVPLYSDARFISEVRDAAGPAMLLNPLRMVEGQIEPAIILRFGFYEEYQVPPASSKPDLSRFSGASVYDEVACLLSLQCGARIAAGGVTREFTERDPLGTPRVDWDVPNIRTRRSATSPMLPWVSEEKRLGEGLLGHLHSLNPEEALILVRSARSYRDAIWIADSDPQLAWLLLVSAVEVVAAHLAVPDNESAEARLRDAAPDLAASLDALGSEAVRQVAPHIAHLLKSTARFLAFFKTFHPQPPPRRPPEGFRFHPWDGGMKKALSVVYDWRCKALHAGIPFPPPMCMPPFPRDPEWEAPCETVPGLAASTKGGIWTREQMPFGLHLFEYLARTSLLAWWASRVHSEGAA
jgi:hypothetical protein